MADRIERAYTNNIYLMESVPPTQQDENNCERKFVVMGSTGNLYKITIGNNPKCSCPDHRMNHKRCKHLYFILMRVMKVTNERQSYYDDEELNEMFDNIPAVARALKPTADIKKNYKQLKEESIRPIVLRGYHNEEEPEEEEKIEEVKLVEQKPIEGNTCPICLDDFVENKNLVYCRYYCGNSLHEKCFNMWSRQNNNKCVYCRGEWIKAIPNPKPVMKAKKRNVNPKKPGDWLKRRGYFNVLTEKAESREQEQEEEEEEEEEEERPPRRKKQVRSKSKKTKKTEREKSKKTERAKSKKTAREKSKKK